MVLDSNNDDDVGCVICGDDITDDTDPFCAFHLREWEENNEEKRS